MQVDRGVAVAAASGSIMRCRWPRAGRPRAASCAIRCCRRRWPSCASSAAKARWSMPPRRTGSRWRCSTRSSSRATSRCAPPTAQRHGVVPPDAALRRGVRCRSALSCAGSGPSSRTLRSCSRNTRSSRSIAGLQPGVHPEIEMGRFLVERAGFANTPPLLGTIEMTLPAAEGEDAPRRWRWACCSASSAIRATAGRWRSTISRAISTTR